MVAAFRWFEGHFFIATLTAMLVVSLAACAFTFLVCLVTVAGTLGKQALEILALHFEGKCKRCKREGRVW